MMRLRGLTFFTALAVSSDATSPESVLEEVPIGRLQKPIIHRPEVFKQALRIIGSLENAPSCHRLATRTLLDSCQILETSKTSDSNVELDQIKSIFAARLAVCELSGAHASIPTQCLVMIPKPSTEDHGFRCLLPRSQCDRVKGSRGKPSFIFEELSPWQIEQCLETLESRPQWWTSYSNARQNAVVMCHAARSEVEREELLETHKSMAKVSSDLNQVISQTTAQSTESLKAQAAFAESVQKLQANVLGDMEHARTELRGFLSIVRGQVEKLFKDTFARIKTSSMKVADNMDNLSSRIKENADETMAARDTLKHSIIAFALQHEGLVKEQLEDSKTAHLSALALQSSLDTIKSQEVEPVERALKDLRTMIDAQMQLMQLMYAKQGNLDGRLDHFNDTVNSLQERATMAEETLKRHVQSQGQIFDDLTTQMLATNDLAASIKTNIEEARNSIANSVLGMLDPIQQVLASWPFFAIAVMIISYLLWGAEVTRRVAVVGIALCTLIFLYEQLLSFRIYWSGPNRSFLPTSVLFESPSVAISVSAVTLATLCVAYIRKIRRRGQQQGVRCEHLAFDAFNKNLHGPAFPSQTFEYSV